MLFKNREVQINLKPKKEEMTYTEPAPEKTVDYVEITKIATEYTVKTIGVIGGVIAANKVLNTICEVTVLAAKAKFK